MVAVASLFALHLSWTSVRLSQHLGVSAIRIIAMLLFWPSLIGVVLCISGSGRMRFFGLVTCLGTGFYWLVLSMGSAISMGAAPIARHPVRYLIPQGYVGWITIEHGSNGPPLEMRDGEYICRIPASGTLATSSGIEDGWAKDDYSYYREDGSLKPLPETGWGAGGMIWGGSVRFEQPQSGSRASNFTQIFYVGTEAQYHRGVYGPN
jgi:hypothetical protein